MKFEIGKILVLEKAEAVEVAVSFKDDSVSYNAPSGKTDVYLPLKEDYTLAEIKSEAIKKAKEFLMAASQSE